MAGSAPGDEMSTQPSKLSQTVYEGLDQGSQDIRLVKLLPSRSHEDPLICFLETVSLNSRPLFESLSYAWGQAIAECPLTVGDGQLLITANLESALRAIRGTEEPVVIWVDAICINQQNLKERNHQVRLMRQIYTSAATVNIWLGTASYGVENALAVLRWLAKGTPLGKIILRMRATKTPVIIEELTAIFEHSWWQRLWVRRP